MKTKKLTQYSDAEEFKHEIDLGLFLEKAGAVRRYASGNFYVLWRESPGKNKTPSLSVRYYSQAGWIWKDWGTLEHGDIFDLVEKIYGITDFQQKIKKILAVWYGAQSQNQQKTQYQKAQIQKQQQPQKIKWVQTSDPVAVSKAMKYLTDKRNLPKWLVKMSMEANLILAFVCYRIIQNLKELIGYGVGSLNFSNGFNIRSIEIDYKHATAQDLTIFYLNKLTEKLEVNHDAIPFMEKVKNVIITESIIDSLSATKILNCSEAIYISLNSTANVNKVFSFLNEYVNYEHHIYGILDNDDSGSETTKKIQNFCRNHGFKFQDYRFIFTGYKDPNDFLKNIQNYKKNKLNFGLNNTTLKYYNESGIANKS